MVNDRHLELSTMLIQMGQALMKEGQDNSDMTLSQAGSGLIALGGLMLDESNLFLFGQMCGLFASKMILDNMERNNHDYLKEKSGKESFDEIIKKINRIRKDSGQDPLP